MCRLPVTRGSPSPPRCITSNIRNNKLLRWKSKFKIYIDSFLKIFDATVKKNKYISIKTFYRNFGNRIFFESDIICYSRTSATRDPGSLSEAESDEENEEGDYTVYECPGLASVSFATYIQS